MKQRKTSRVMVATLLLGTLTAPQAGAAWDDLLNKGRKSSKDKAAPTKRVPRFRLELILLPWPVD
jgi:hypothetical protein